jgi:ABC-type transport system substrate-binding protein
VAEDLTCSQNEQSNGNSQTGWTALTSDILDPSENVLLCCASNGRPDSSYVAWKGPAADALYDGAQNTLNQARRCQLYDQWQPEIMRKAPLIWLANAGNSFADHSDVHEFFRQDSAHRRLRVAWKS